MTKIRYARTLVYYDGPQVFEARDAIGGHYIAVMGPPDEEIRYLVAGVAPEQLSSFCAGQKDLRELVMESDADSRYTTTTTPSSAGDELAPDAFREPLQTSGFLPEPGFVLTDPWSAEIVAPAKNLRLELTLDGAPGRIATAAYLELLYRVQLLVKHALATMRLGTGGRPNFLWKDGIFDVVVPAVAGSFRVLLEPSSLQSPEFSTKMATALHRIDALFRHSRNEDLEELMSALRANQGRLAGPYLKLLQLLSKNRTGLRYAWRAHEEIHRIHSGAVSIAQADALVETLSKARLGRETRVLEGQLYRFNSETGYWGLMTDEGRKLGWVKGEPLDHGVLRVGGRYSFTCELEYDFATEDSDTLEGSLYLVEHEPLPE